MNHENSKIALSFDVEDLYNIRRANRRKSSKIVDPEGFSTNREGMFDCLTKSFFNILELLEKNNVRATFFVVANILERYPRVAEALKASSHEIGCHSLDHLIPIDPITGNQIQSNQEWAEELQIAKSLLENYFEKKIIGYRAPAAYLCDWMIEILLQQGFKYDSSIADNLFYNKTNVILRDIPTYPYIMSPVTLGEMKGKLGLIELPWSTFKVFGKKFPAGGGFFYRLLGNAYFGRALEQCLEGGDTMFYIHPLDFSDEIFYSNKRPAYWINKGEKTIKNFSRLLTRFEGRWTTCEDVYERFKVKANNDARPGGLGGLA